MFQFPGFALNPYGFRVQYPHGPRSAKPDNRLTSRYGVEGGFPHSEILGSKLVRSSPRLIAAYHVLHRLSAPRHPPNALKALDHSHDRCPPPLSGQRTQSERPRLRISPKTLCLPNTPDQERGHALAGRRTLGGPTIRCIPSLRFQTSQNGLRPLAKL